MDIAIPEYTGNSIYNLANTLFFELGLPTRGPRLKLDIGIEKKIVLILIDGLGYQDLVNVFGDQISKIAGEVYRITTVFPTTTATALTTLSTGLPPSVHGVVGPNVYVKELGMVINTLNMGPIIGERDGLVRAGHDLRNFFPVGKSLFDELKDLGIRNRVYVPKGLSGGLSKLIFTDTEFFEYVTHYDAITNAAKFLQELNTAFVYIYITNVDSAAHKYGPNSEEFRENLYETVNSVINLTRKYLRGCTTIITADHGHDEITTNVNANNIGGLMNLLDVPPYGDARAVHLKTTVNVNKDDLMNVLSKAGLKGVILSRGEVVSMGLLGDREGDGIKRVGDFIFLPESGMAMIYLYGKGGEELLNLKGHHGGLTARELYVPLIILR